MDGERFAAFLAAAVLLAVIPGPGMLYVAARTLGGGRRQGLISTGGTAIGGGFHVVAAAVGLSALLATSSTAYVVVKYAGAAYLIVLGIRTLLRARREGLGPPAPSDRHAGSGRLARLGRSGSGAALRQGALTEMLNPKTALFFLAFVPQFVDPSAGSVLVRSVVLGAASVTLNSAADVAAVALAGAAHRRLGHGGRPARWPGVASGGALLALGGYAAVES